MKTAVPDHYVTVENLVTGGDQVVTRFTLTGTVTGSIRVLSHPERIFSVRGLTYYRLSNGKIVEDDPVWHRLDRLERWQVLARPASCILSRHFIQDRLSRMLRLL